MKRNSIIYPNTPFFRKYAGKLIMPAGVEEEGGAAFELVPAEITSVFAGMTTNPYFETDNDDAAALFALVGPSVESVRFKIDNLTAEYTGSDSDDIFNVSPMIINEEFLEEVHNVDIDYFDDKIGQYVTMITIAIYHMEGYTPLAVGEHPYELTVNGTAVSAGKFIVEAAIELVPDEIFQINFPGLSNPALVNVPEQGGRFVLIATTNLPLDINQLHAVCTIGENTYDLYNDSATTLYEIDDAFIEDMPNELKPYFQTKKGSYYLTAVLATAQVLETGDYSCILSGSVEGSSSVMTLWSGTVIAQ